jgi:pyrroline-5-carboxylate reductase
VHRLGFIGTGVVTEAVIHGLLAGAPFEVHVSPRSETRSRALASTYPSVTREASNAAVVSNSDIVFLAVRPQDAGVLAGLPFRADQTVVSFLAGTALERVRDWVVPATRVVRLVPLPCIRQGKGPILMTPADPLVAEIFGTLGDLIQLDEEQDLAAIAIASGLMSSHFELQNTMIQWLAGKGVPKDAAGLYVRSFFVGLGEIGLASQKSGAAIDPKDYETSGGLNETGRAFLKTAGWFDRARDALDAVEAHSLTLG